MKKFSIADYSFIIKEKDEDGYYTLTEAKILCANLGNGWRVPNLDELEIIYNEFEAKGKDKLSNELNIQFNKKYYLTDTVDEYDGWPLSFDFENGSSYISSINSKHKLRLIKDELASTQSVQISKADFIEKITSVLKKYVPNLNTVKFINFLNKCHTDSNLNFNEVRYVTLEDTNMCNEPDSFYVAHFHQDEDLLLIWENDFYACGYSEDELNAEEETRDTYIGFLDLLDQKYICVNGHGESIEYNREVGPGAFIDWSSWC